MCKTNLSAYTGHVKDISYMPHETPYDRSLAALEKPILPDPSASVPGF